MAYWIVWKFSVYGSCSGPELSLLQYHTCDWLFDPRALCDEVAFLYLRREAVVKNFSTSFWLRFSQAPLCRYRFKFIFDDIIFLLSGNIIEYICFWRFNSIIMTWNKLLVFTKSVIMGLNNITLTLPAWLCLFTVRNYMTLFNTLALHAIRWCSGMSLASHGEGPWFETHTIPCSISYFYCYHCFVLFALFFTQWLIYPFPFTLIFSYKLLFSI